MYVHEVFLQKTTKQVLHASVLDIKVYYYPWNIAIPRVVMSLISNTVKVKSLIYYTHYTCIQNSARALKIETMHSSKTTLYNNNNNNNNNNKKATVTSVCLATCCFVVSMLFMECRFERRYSESGIIGWAPSKYRPAFVVREWKRQPVSCAGWTFTRKSFSR